MNKVLDYNREDGLIVNEDDGILTTAITSLVRNNTFCPNITKLLKKKDKRGKEVLTVSFADGTWTSVTRNENDPSDDTMAFLYALAKRLIGKPTTGGYVTGDGFMEKIKGFVGSIKTEKDLEIEKQERIKEKLARDAEEHRKAVERRNRHPNVNNRLRNLEDKFDKLIDILKGCSEGPDEDELPKKNGRGFRGFFSK